MKLNEIQRIINDNSFEKLKDVDLYNEVNRTYSQIYSVYRNNPDMSAKDVFGTDYEDISLEVSDLFNRVKIVYLESDNTYARIENVWKYINQ